MNLLLFDLPGLLLVLAALAFACPWAALALGAQRTALLTTLTTIALSTGALTLWMMALALAGGLTLANVLAGMALIAALGAAALWRSGWRLVSPTWVVGRVVGALQGAHRGVWPYAPTRTYPIAAAAALVTALLAALVAFNLAYWPFSIDDAVSIYAMHSRTIYETRALPTGDGLYEAYPMLLPLGYAYSYLAAGAMNEYLARLFAAALGLGAYGVAAALGGALYDRRTGLIAALLLALTPLFGYWAGSGYTDVPAGFFGALAALFAARLLRGGAGRDALLAGIMVGLAAWTKNSALALALSLAGALAYGMLPGRESGVPPSPALPPQGGKGDRRGRLARDGGRGTTPQVTAGVARVTARHAALAAAGLLASAGPWYARNLIAFGRAVPETVWTERAQPTIANLVPFLRYAGPGHLVVPGVVFTAGMALAAAEALRGSGARREGTRVLVAFALPFAAAWWWLASYEVRFLMVILPLVAVMGARALVWAWEATPGAWRRGAMRAPVQLAAIALIVALALPAARKAVLFKGDILRDPLMDDATRHRVALGPVYDAARYLNDLPAGGTILSDTYYLPFHVRTARVVVGGLPDRAALARYDYLVLSPGRPLPAAAAPGDLALLAEPGGYGVYRVTYPVTANDGP